jgi:adenine phosphoribosyltransferase
MKIAITSKNPLKINVVEKILGKNNEIISIESNIDTPANPLNLGGMMACVKRIENALPFIKKNVNKTKKTFDLIISIENGMVIDNDNYYDVCFCCIKCGDKIYQNYGSFITIPSKFKHIIDELESLYKIKPIEPIIESVEPKPIESEVKPLTEDVIESEVKPLIEEVIETEVKPLTEDVIESEVKPLIEEVIETEEETNEDDTMTNPREINKRKHSRILSLNKKIKKSLYVDDDADLSFIEGYSKTFGELLVEHGLSKSPKNWMRTLVGVDREDQMENVLLHTFTIIDIKNTIITYKNFPKKGVNFMDIMPVFNSPRQFVRLVDLMAHVINNNNIKTFNKIIGLESRGFILGGALANKLKCGFVAFRKKGKLPGKIISSDYEKEYGFDTFEAQQSSFSEGENVIIVDDVLATGGSLIGAIELAYKLKVNVVACLVVMRVDELYENAYAKIMKTVINPDTFKLIVLM